MAVKCLLCKYAKKASNLSFDMYVNKSTLDIHMGIASGHLHFTEMVLYPSGIRENISALKYFENITNFCEINV